MNVVIQMIVSSVAALLGAFLAAGLTYRNMRAVEGEKISRRREAVGTVVQAELAHFYRELSDHAEKLDGYLKKVTGIVGATTKTDFPKIEIGEQFSSVYQSVISEIGLFDTETSYVVVFCYSNIFKFMRDQELLISELDSLMNSTMLEQRVRNLYAHEEALLQQIKRVMARLAQGSRAIPFTPKPRKRRND
jgi:hypothetical protein